MARNTKTITIKLFDGTLSGFIKASIEHVWTGLVFSGSRNDENFSKHTDIRKSGAYLLIEECKGKPNVYIGQTTNVSKRLKEHKKDKDKEFWGKTCIVICPNINTDDLKYLERSLIEAATNCRQVHLVNKIKQNARKLENSNMDEFILNIHLILPMLGFDFLQQRPLISSTPSLITSTHVQQPNTSPIFKLHNKMRNVKARAQFINGKFTVLRNSEINKHWKSKSKNQAYKALHTKVVSDEEKVTSKGNDKVALKVDEPFQSYAHASAVVQGRPSDGEKLWKLEGSNRALQDWLKDNK